MNTPPLTLEQLENVAKTIRSVRPLDEETLDRIASTAASLVMMVGLTGTIPPSLMKDPVFLKDFARMSDPFLLLQMAVAAKREFVRNRSEEIAGGIVDNIKPA